MQTSLTLKEFFRIPAEIIKAYPLYLSITHEQEDHQLLAPMQNVFATTLQSANNQPECFCNELVAYAAGIIFKLIIDQDTKLLEELLQQAQLSKDEKIVWAFQLIQFTIYQLYKSDTPFYLNILLNNKQIPKPQLNEEQTPLTASSIYSLVMMTEMHLFFQKIQLSKRIPYQCINDSKFQSDVEITIYQLTKTYPAIVLIKYDETRLQQHIWNKHVEFLKDVFLQLLMDAMPNQQSRSTLVEKLKFQPYVVYSYQEFCTLLLVADQDKLKQILSIQQFEKFFNEELRSKDFTASCEKVKQKLTVEFIDSDNKHLKKQTFGNGNGVGDEKQAANEEVIDVFKTAAPKSVAKTAVKRFQTVTR